MACHLSQARSKVRWGQVTTQFGGTIVVLLPGSTDPLSRCQTLAIFPFCGVLFWSAWPLSWGSRFLFRIWFNGRYEFSEADAACALQAIDSWVESAAHGAQHISPEKVRAPLHLPCLYGYMYIYLCWGSVYALLRHASEGGVCSRGRLVVSRTLTMAGLASPTCTCVVQKLLAASFMPCCFSWELFVSMFRQETVVAGAPRGEYGARGSPTR